MLMQSGWSRALILLKRLKIRWESSPLMTLISRKCQYNVVEIRTIGVIPFLSAILKHEDKDLTFETLELVRQLTENDDEDEGKAHFSGCGSYYFSSSLGCCSCHFRVVLGSWLAIVLGC